jgi:pimeloyl-ACP methyl ester carboxylesterase
MLLFTYLKNYGGGIAMVKNLHKYEVIDDLSQKTVEGYADIRNQKIYYEISGNPNGEWLVLIHGISGSTRCWKNQMDDFNQHFRVLNVDLLGHGNSTALEDYQKYNVSIMANYLRLLMDQLGIEKAHFCGLSLGTIIQQYFCELFPERIISCIFASPICKTNYLTKIVNSFADKIFLKIFSTRTYTKLMGHMMLPGKAHETLKVSSSEFRKWWKVVVQGDHYKCLGKYNIPSLIVVGNQDFCFYDDSLELKEKFTNSEFKVIKGAGHVFIFQKAAEFNQIVIDYISSLQVATVTVTEERKTIAA